MHVEPPAESALPPADVALPAWAALPFPVVGLLVRHLGELPGHQGRHAVAALRATCIALCEAVDDCITQLAVDRTWVPFEGEAERRAGARALQRWRYLASLGLHGASLDAPLLRALAGARAVSHLAIGQCTAPVALVTATLPALAASLRELDLDLPQGSALPSLAPLTSLTGLEALSLVFADAVDHTADVAAVVGTCPHLARLTAYRCVRALPWAKQQVFDIAGATALTSLRLSASFTEDAAWEELFCSLTRLQELDIRVSPCLGDAGLLAITSLSASLTALKLQGDSKLTPNGLTALAALTGLQSLSITWANRLADRSLPPLIAGRLKQLTHLDLSGLLWERLPFAFDHLTSLESLRSLELAECHLGAEHAASIGRMAGLERANLSLNYALGRGRSLAPLARLGASLTELHLIEFGSGDCEFLSTLTRLQHLSLEPLQTIGQLVTAGFAREALAHLAAGAAGSLTQLRLSAPLGPGGVQRLGQLTALQVLDISGSRGALEVEEVQRIAGGDPPPPLDAAQLLAALRAMPHLHTLDMASVRVGLGHDRPLSRGEWRQLAAEQLPGLGLLRMRC